MTVKHQRSTLVIVTKKVYILLCNLKCAQPRGENKLPSSGVAKIRTQAFQEPSLHSKLWSTHNNAEYFILPRRLSYK